MKIDDIDKKILNLLQQDAKMSHKAIAEHLEISTTPVYERIKKMERNGIIMSYVALVNPEALGKDLIVIISAQLKEHTKPAIHAFKEHISCLPEVNECYHIAGSSDFIIKIHIDDMKSYNNFVMEKLSTMEGIAHLESNFVLSTVKKSTIIDLN